MGLFLGLPNGRITGQASELLDCFAGSLFSFDFLRGGSGVSDRVNFNFSFTFVRGGSGVSDRVSFTFSFFLEESCVLERPSRNPGPGDGGDEETSKSKSRSLLIELFRLRRFSCWWW